MKKITFNCSIYRLLFTFTAFLMLHCIYVGSAFAKTEGKNNAIAETAMKPKLGPLHYFEITPSKTPVHERIFHLGQNALEGKIELNSTNGFFDRCFEAQSAGKIDTEDSTYALNPGKFTGLIKAKREGTTLGTARWHLWVSEPGEVRAEFLMDVATSDVSHPWLIQLGDEKQQLTVHATKGAQLQKQVLSFTVKKKGKVTFTIDCAKVTPPKATKICQIQLSGSAIKKAKLLRARWRPGAVHSRLEPIKNAEKIKPGMWVFESKATNLISSYSPMTTPFGYFGLSFREGKILTGSGFNFSMWIANAKKETAPAPELTPRVIGTSIPDAAYSIFGHEGTGMKFRNAVAYPNGADRTIQALRIEFDKETNLATYYGYFYNEDKQRWVLYASGQAPPKRKDHSATVERDGTVSFAGSFCEVPGPPVRERSGDQVRTIERKGWFYGKDGQWYPAKLGTSRIMRRKAGEFEKGLLAGDQYPKLNVANKQMAYSKDYKKSGWIAMETGGMEFRSPYSFLAASDTLDPPAMSKVTKMPEYLKPDKVKQLFELPVSFGLSKTEAVKKNSATIKCELKKTGPNSKAMLWYGTVDCVVFSPRKVTRGSAVHKDLFRPERTWQNSTTEQPARKGENQFKLTNLKPKTKYYYRLYVEHDEGKSWDYNSGSFTTK